VDDDRTTEVTQCLTDSRLNATERGHRLLPLVYEELRAIARQRMAGERVEAFVHSYGKLEREVHKVIVGHDEIVDQVLVALFAGGHVLLEGVPGLGKTLLVRTLAGCLDLSFSRIQFTPDLMPADIIGTNIIVEDADADPYGARLLSQRAKVKGVFCPLT
jgi:MoxR-like ATPase